MGDHKAAIELLAANAGGHPASASAQFGLGRAYQAAGDAENAKLHFRKALEIDPNYRKASDGLNALR
jgi:Tfp pilus assembly protein PilF